MARRLLVLFVVVAGVAALFLAGVHNLRARRARMQQSQIVLVKDGDKPPMGDTATADDLGTSLKGKTAPEFTLADVTGKKVSLADFKGHPVVINFWATYCGPCKLEMPWLTEFVAKYKDQGLVVLGIDQDDDVPVAKVGDTAKKFGADYTILMPDKGIAKSYALSDYVPETFYVDKNGRIVEQNIGAPSKDEMEANVKKAIAE